MRSYIISIPYYLPYFSAVFTSDSNTEPLRGTYTPGPDQTAPGKFRPLEPSKAPHSDQHGEMRVPSSSTPLSGTLDAPDAPTGVGAVVTSNFYLDPANSLQVNFVPDMSPTSMVRGVFIITETGGTFLLIVSSSAPPLPANGFIVQVTTGAQLSHGTLSSSDVPNSLIFTKDPVNSVFGNHSL